MTFPAFEAACAAAIATRAAPATRRQYARVLGRWLTFLEEREGADPRDPPDELVAAYRESFTRDKLSPSTLRNHLAALSFIYRRLSVQRSGSAPPAAVRNPFDPDVLSRPRTSTIGKTEALPEEVADQMIAAARADADQVAGLRDAALLRLLWDTGLRRMSIASLRRDKLLRRDGKVFARVQVKGSGGEEQKEASLPAETAAAVSAWLEVSPSSPWVFPARRGRGHIDLSTINKTVTRRAEEVGAVHVHPHRFRAAFITSAFDRGSHWRDIQASVHHEDPRSTQRYDRGQRGGGVAEAVMEYRNKKKKKAGKGKKNKKKEE